MARVEVITKPGCHLCEDAVKVIAEVTNDLGIEWEEKSVADDPRLLERYREEIPVTLVDGEVHDFWRVDPDRLRSALNNQ
jgi:glutaredoxin